MEERDRREKQEKEEKLRREKEDAKRKKAYEREMREGDTDEANVLRHAPVQTETPQTATQLLRRGLIDPTHAYKMRWDLFIGLLTLIAVNIVLFPVTVVEWVLRWQARHVTVT